MPSVLRRETCTTCTEQLEDRCRATCAQQLAESNLRAAAWNTAACADTATWSSHVTIHIGPSSSGFYDFLWIQQNKWPNLCMLGGYVGSLRVWQLVVWVSSGLSGHHGSHLRALRKVFFSMQKFQVRCIHDHMVDTTKQTTHFMRTGRLCWLSAGAETRYVGLQSSI